MKPDYTSIPNIFTFVPSKENMKNLSILFLMFICVASLVKGQTLVVQATAKLPTLLSESSGLVLDSSGQFWSHNDSGRLPELYGFDASGSLRRIIKILNNTNTDWEDVCSDHKGNFYIGDFGNNDNNRQDLRVLKVPEPGRLPADSVIPEIISFSYSNQTAFPPADAGKFFDMEAMFCFNDSLYLFSKNRSNPYTGYTYMYQLPARAGTFVANLLDSFYTGPGPWLLSSVTGAAISPSGKGMLLLAYDKCWLFSGFSGKRFFRGQSRQFNFPSLTQKEGVVFLNDTMGYITDEMAGSTGGNLYTFSIQQSSVNTEERNELAEDVLVYPNPFSSDFSIVFNESSRPDSVALVSGLGVVIGQQWVDSRGYTVVFSVTGLCPGVYFLYLYSDKGIRVKKVLCTH